MGKRILFLETVHPVLAEKLNELGFECEFNYSILYDELLKSISEYHGIVLRSRIAFDQQLIEAGTNLEFIARSGSGLEIIDLETCEKNNVKVFSSPEGNSDAVGEHVVGMLLALANNIHLANASVRRKEWLREEHRGFEIKGKTSREGVFILSPKLIGVPYPSAVIVIFQISDSPIPPGIFDAKNKVLPSLLKLG